MSAPPTATAGRSGPAAAPSPRDPSRTGDGRAGDGHTGAEPSVGSLLRELADESRTLLRQEVALAKTEMSEKLHRALRDLVAIGAGGVVLVVAAFLFFTALTTGLVSLLELAVSHDVAVWLAPLLLGIVLAIVGFAMVKKGAAELGDASLVPHKTIDSLERDKNWIKEHTS